MKCPLAGAASIAAAATNTSVWCPLSTRRMARIHENKVEFTGLEFDKIQNSVHQQSLGLASNDNSDSFKVEFQVLFFGLVKTHAVLQRAVSIDLGGDAQRHLSGSTRNGSLLNLFCGSAGYCKHA